MNWEIWFKTESDFNKLYEVNDMTNEQIKEHLRNKFKDEIEHKLKVEFTEYQDDGELPPSIEYCLSDENNCYVYGFHAFQMEEKQT